MAHITPIFAGALAALALSIGPCGGARASQGGRAPQDIPAKTVPGPPPPAVDAAIRAPLIRYNRNLKGGAHTNMAGHGGAPVILAAAAFAGNRTADARLLEQMRYTITGGNDISANGGYPAQHERHVTAMYAIARLTPRIWERLSADEAKKVDLLMTAALVASAFTTSDANPYVLAHTQQHALDGDANLNRDWNPNYREGMVGMLLIAPVYFGGAGKAQALLDTYDHAAFVRELARHGLTNIHQTFTWKAAHPESDAPTPPLIEKAVRGFRYKGTPLSDPMKIYWLLTTDTYSKTVNCGLQGGKGIALPDGSRAGMLLSGCEALPNKGKPGMLKELDSNDANGPRSSLLYAYDGLRPNLTNHYVLIAGGYWRPGKLADECLALMQVGINDLWYKLAHGYRNYAKGKAQSDLRLGATDHGFPFTRPLWESVVKPYHGL